MAAGGKRISKEVHWPNENISGVVANEEAHVLHTEGPGFDPSIQKRARKGENGERIKSLHHIEYYNYAELKKNSSSDN